MSQSHSPRRGQGNGRRRSSSSAPSARKTDSSIAPLQPTLTPPDIQSFREWNLGEELQGGIAGMGITVPTPIQRLAIQAVLDGRDVIAKAETGTGKTLAFGAPMMAKIDPARASVLGLVLCPTRELAEQVQKVLEILGKSRGVKTALVVGGEPLEPQVNALKAGAQVVVGTPGRVLDLYKQRFLQFPWTEFAILDEADVMLEIGFIDDVKMILSFTPDERQTLLFSATFPPELLKLAREYTKNPVEVATASGVSTVDNISQCVIRVSEDERALALIRLIEQSAPEDVFLVFCDRRTEVDKLMRRVERLPYSIKALHGGYDQAARFRVMSAFRTGEVKALVATDVASRGLDVVHVTHVVNYTAPQDITDYTHRIGRTGRAGRKGRAITLVGDVDMRKWNQILHEATWKIPEEQIPHSSRMGGRDRDRPRGGDRERPAHAERGPRREDAPRETESPRRDESSRTDDSRHGSPRRHDAPRRDEAPRHAPAARRDDVERTDVDASRSAPRRPVGARDMDSARDERRTWPRDDKAPRSDDRAPRAPRSADPVDRRAPIATPPPRPQRWPEDEDAHIEAARGRDLRPNRSSPPPAHGPRREAQHTAHSESERRRPQAREPQREERAPRRDDRAPREMREASDVRPPRRAPAESRTDAPGNTRDVPVQRSERAATPKSEPQRETRPRDHDRGEERTTSRRAPAARTTREPEEVSARDERRPTRAPSARSTPAKAPTRASEPSNTERPARASAPREPAPRSAPPRESAPRSAPPRREDTRPPARKPALEERPPGTFERPMSGGLLGHATRRTPEPRADERRGRGSDSRGGRGRPNRDR